MNPTELKKEIENLNRLVREGYEGRQFRYITMEDTGFCIVLPSFLEYSTELRRNIEKCFENAVELANKRDSSLHGKLYFLQRNGKNASSPYIITAKQGQIPLANFVYCDDLMYLQVFREKCFESIILEQIYSLARGFCFLDR